MEIDFGSSKGYLIGSRIHIGGGRETIIGQAAWLPNQDNGFITSFMSDNLTSATVDSLMVPNQRRWDFDVVADIFSNRDRELIQQIPLGSWINQDDWYSLPDSKMQYTVHSCYKMLENQPSPLTTVYGDNCGSFQFLQRLKNFFGVLWPM